jgi:molybdenum cofactor cytidylyltransferase
LEAKELKLGCIFMASGHSIRFGSDKLVYPLCGIPMICHALDSLPKGLLDTVAVVTRSDYVAKLAKSRGFFAIKNPDASNDTAITIRLGLYAMPEYIDGCMFSVCDQPYLTGESIIRLTEAFFRQPNSIVALSWRGIRGNPVIFPSSLFNELRCLPSYATGKYVIDRHRDKLVLVSAFAREELWDIDRPDDFL